MAESGDDRGQLQLGGVRDAAVVVGGPERVLVGKETFGVVAAQVGRAEEVRGAEAAADLMGTADISVRISFSLIFNLVSNKASVLA